MGPSQTLVEESQTSSNHLERLAKPPYDTMLGVLERRINAKVAWEEFEDSVDPKCYDNKTSEVSRERLCR
ncbi:MAG: hypothetical protein DRI81_02585 [Chloroflexi bacterium]|nr:MAG: hypothetical protein DRI81_02585 [Chloroflexota bacterium]